jgi:uncharacterized protein (TIGR02246 family)
MNILRFLCAGALAVATVLAQSEGEVRRQIEAAQQKWGKAWNERDLETMLSLYAEDAQAYSPDSGITKGRAAMRQRFERAFKPENHAPETATTLDVLAQGEFATETGTWVAKSEDGTEEGSYLTVWRKIGGEWKVLREIYNSTGKTSKLPSSLSALEPLLGNWVGETTFGDNKLRVTASWQASQSGSGIIHEATGTLNGERIEAWTEFVYAKADTKTLAVVGASAKGEHDSGVVLVREGKIIFQQTGVTADGEPRVTVNEFRIEKNSIFLTQLVAFTNGQPDENRIQNCELKRVQ